ncbi:MAG: T9SS C-terminal target domain-containing protein [Chitinophagaceae bacterium]|nr:MAG: T9SS C-terminal target domain-containing protein [Chitinophagaceae bacterium]
MKKMKKNILAFLIVLLNTFALTAQPVFEQIHNIPVHQNNQTIDKAWLGGLNYPQFNAADLNNNGIDDLVVFDKSGNRILTFLNSGQEGEISYTYAPEYAEYFPNVQHWMILTDFNCDGVPDLFFSGNNRIEYYRGKYTDGKLDFEYVDYLRYQGFSGPLNIFVSTVDYPAIVDVNGDGVKDILAFHMLGGFVLYFKNNSMDTHGNCDGNLIFEQADNCWGDFYESASSKGVSLVDSCVGFFLPPVDEYYPDRRHAGSTLTALDINNNGVQDLLVGDVEYSNIVFLLNGGTPDLAKMVQQDSLFPNYDIPIHMPTMPANFLVDINNNGKKDLIVAPTDMYSATETLDCAWLYLNVGDEDSMIFQKESSSFLVGDMIDAGQMSRPVFVDISGNGLKDLIIGNNGYYTGPFEKTAALTYYENTGTPEEPEFTLITRDFGSLSQLNKVYLSPAFADLNNNGKKELVVGDEDGSLHLFVNVSAVNEPAVYVLEEEEWIRYPWTFSTPYFYDINGNGLYDLLVGERQGTIKLMLNKGTQTNFDFDITPDNPFFGGIDARKPMFIDGYTSPAIIELDNQKYVLTGSEARGLLLYAFNPDSILEGKFDLTAEDFSQTNVGQRSAPALTKFSPEGQLHMVLGNMRGGLQLYRLTQEVSVEESIQTVDLENIVNIYPNPASTFINIEFSNLDISNRTDIEVFNIQGQLLRKIENVNSRVYRVDVSDLSPGMYLIKVRNAITNQVQKLIVH